MSKDRMTALAMQLIVLGVSKVGIERLLTNNDLDEVERQLAYLPFRNAKRPEAFIVEAIKYRYSAPKGFFHAANQTESAGHEPALDEDAELPDGQAHGRTEGH